MTIAELRTHLEKQGKYNATQINLILFPHLMSARIDEWKSVGMNNKEILSNINYIAEREFNFNAALIFCDLVERFLRQKKIESFGAFFQNEAKLKAGKGGVR